MFKRENIGGISNEKSKELKKERSVNETKIKIVNKIIEQIKEVLEYPAEKKDSTERFRRHHQGHI